MVRERAERARDENETVWIVGFGPASRGIVQRVGTNKATVSTARGDRLVPLSRIKSTDQALGRPE